MSIEIFTVKCQVCGSYLAGHVVRASPETYADIGASTVDALRAGRIVSLTTGTVRLGGCTKDCQPIEQNKHGERDA